MKREIKFRGLRTDGKGWVYGVPISISQIEEEEPEDSINVSCIVTGCDWNGVFGFMPIPNELVIEVIPESVGQFTGLKDVNGTEIYEGDYLYCNQWNPTTYIVRFLEGAFCLWTDEDGFMADINMISDSTGIHFGIKGNIHQN